MVRDMFKIRVAGRSENFRRVRIGCICIVQCVLIKNMLCVVQVAKGGLFLPQKNMSYRYRGNRENL